MSRIITLPRDLRVDIDHVPEDFEAQVQKVFAEYTSGTNPVYMFEDKLCFIDAMIARLHKLDASDGISHLIKARFAHELDEYGELTEPEEFLSIAFMEDCYTAGESDRKLYSFEYAEDRHDNEKIMKVICRAIKAVMDYEG